MKKQKMQKPNAPSVPFCLDTPYIGCLGDGCFQCSGYFDDLQIHRFSAAAEFRVDARISGKNVEPRCWGHKNVP